MEKYSGIDVSKWQGRIDWPLVKSDGVQFAMIRSSFGWNEGNTDLLFETNYENATKVGIPVGAYHYSYARTPAEAIKEADFCFSVIKGKTFEYPIAYDLEESNIASLGKERVSEIAKAFCKRMESYGYYVCIYANKHWLDNYFTDEILGRYDIWLAQWTTKPTFEKTYGIWQKSSKGRVAGIQGYVDLDEAYKHYPSIMKYNGLNGFPKPQSGKPQKPEKKDYSAGAKIILEDSGLYATATVTKPTRNVSGEYYIYDGKVINGRMRVTNSASRVGRKPVGDNVTGFVKKSEMG